MKVIIQVKSEQLNEEDLRLLLQAIQDCHEKNFQNKEISIDVEAPNLPMLA